MKMCCTVVLILLAVPQLARAQIRVGDLEQPRLIISEKAIATALATTSPSLVPPQDQRDSVKNGAIVGAIIGGAAMGGFVTWLCHALKESGDPSCWKGVAVWTGLGAGAGAAGGAGIDALFTRYAPAPARADRLRRD